MELCEMIKVMENFDNGGEVEIKSKNSNDWYGLITPSWNWFEYDYRIEEPNQKVTIEKWLCQNDKGTFITIETSNIDEYVYYKKVKLIESYEVEL